VIFQVPSGRDGGDLDLLAGAERGPGVETLEQVRLRMELLAQRFQRGSVTEGGQLGLLLHVDGHAHERAGHVGRRDRVGDEGRRPVCVEGGGARAPTRLRECGQGEARVRAVTAVDLTG
jgi:hypothetical protein